MNRIVLDTNVLISGLLFGGPPGRILELAREGRITLLVSQPIVDEYLRVLAYPKFQLTPAEIEQLLKGHILPFCEVVATPSPGSWCPDPDDDTFLACALAGKAQCVVSGDAHLLDMQSPPVLVLTPVQLLSDLGVDAS